MPCAEFGSLGSAALAPLLGAAPQLSARAADSEPPFACCQKMCKPYSYMKKQHNDQVCAVFQCTSGICQFSLWLHWLYRLETLH